MEHDFSHLDPDTLVTCPFDEVHRVTVRRLVHHMTKCYKNCNKHDYKFCPFSRLHVVLSSELENHIQRCEYRKLVDLQIQPATKEGGNLELPVANSQWCPETEEDWDSEATPSHKPSPQSTKQSKQNMSSVPAPLGRGRGRGRGILGLPRQPETQPM